MILAIIENAFLSLIGSAIPASAVVMLAATGAMLGERVGVLNLGQEGLIGIGAVYSVIAVLSWGVESPWLAMLIGMAAAAVAGLIFAVCVVAFRASQVLVGLALALGGIGLSNQLGTNRNGTPIQTLFREVNPGGVLDNHDAVSAFFFHDPVVYIAYIGLPAVLWFVLFRTRHGMNMRAVGENPAAADAVGVSVTG
ncbi:MAG: ABC transporter permease, partial [Candidatus Aminicenantes bacterium]|nr:ABC transporter permease [Candidatus Aminicenantes bacterium]